MLWNRRFNQPFQHIFLEEENAMKHATSSKQKSQNPDSDNRRISKLPWESQGRKKKGTAAVK
jgi:hypothetical protein